MAKLADSLNKSIALDLEATRFAREIAAAPGGKGTGSVADLNLNLRMAPIDVEVVEVGS